MMHSDKPSLTRRREGGATVFRRESASGFEEWWVRGSQCAYRAGDDGSALEQRPIEECQEAKRLYAWSADSPDRENTHQ